MVVIILKTVRLFHSTTRRNKKQKTKWKVLPAVVYERLGLVTISSMKIIGYLKSFC